MNSAQEQLAGEIIREQQKLAGDRGPWDSLYAEIAKRITPSQLQQFNPSALSQPGGDVKTNEIFDSTGATSLGRFASIMESVLTPRDSTWHSVIPSDERLMKDKATRLWMETATRMLFKFRYAPKANFSSQNYMRNEALGAFGTGGLFIDDLQGERFGMRYKHIHLAGLHIIENHQGIIDGAYRYFGMEARQAAQKWGEEKLPQAIRSSLARDPQKQFYFIHRVKQKDSWDPERRDYRGRPFSSCYVSIEGKMLMEENGYFTFPIPVSRYKQAANEVYGRSPAMEVLPSLKCLNEMKKQVLKQGQRVLDPVLLMHDDGLADIFSMRAGAMNPGGVSADGRPLVHTLPTGQIMAGKELMDDERADVKDAFLVTLFQILTENPQMTASEVLERSKEKGMLIAPTMGRQQSESLGPQIERELDILMRQGALPSMPPALIEAKGEYTIMYDSPLSRAQRAEEAAGLMRTAEFAKEVFNITQDRAVLRPFKWQQIIPDLADINGVPAKWMNSAEEMAALAESEQEQADTQTAIQAAPAAAAMVKADAAAQKVNAG